MNTLLKKEQDVENKEPFRLGKWLSLLPIMIFLSVSQAVVFTLLWSWFLVPIGIKHISIQQGYGIILVINFLQFNTKKVVREQEHDLEYWQKYTRVSGTAILTYLITGWIIHLILYHL